MTQVCKRCDNDFTPNKDWHEFCNGCARFLLDIGWTVYQIDNGINALKTTIHNRLTFQSE